MKLYNKILGALYVASSFLSFSAEVAETYPVKMLTHPDVTEPKRFSEKPEIQMLYYEGEIKIKRLLYKGVTLCFACI